MPLDITNTFLPALEPLPWPTVTVPSLILLTWAGLVQAFRWRRHNYIQRVYGPKYTSGTMTAEDAQQIINLLIQYEMPLILEYALAFALFKTYAIPSISKILASTKELSTSEGISKRYADTSILISTWVTCPISGMVQQTANEKLNRQDPRANLAIARTNWLHSRYNIRNDDYLYTLALFAFEPAVRVELKSLTNYAKGLLQKWAAKYGWRPLTPLEEHAFYIFWVEIGKRMGINDIPESAEEFKEWVEDFEAKYMVPAQTNHDVATYTTEELIYPLPEAFGIKNFARKVSIAVLEDNVRTAMMQPEQPKWISTLLNTLLNFMAWHIRYFHLPTFKSYGQVSTEMPQFKDGEEPLMTPRYFQPKPWYKPEATSLLGRLKDWCLVKIGKHDSFPSPALRSRGYRLDTIGPLKFEQSGQEEVLQNAEKLLGCPITGAWRTPAST
ncbi:hypothetical protein V5O48_000857 [Marasmius crinis-equi]|uniref:ER-bound oxygenase mpaB/mpaB'/Rubber oxygenase catalytic domain-containing protein n=1 Tax=Marasmius crinis-equi TaxID=585013 RepID=A0ABR3G0Q5_9AGAR